MDKSAAFLSTLRGLLRDIPRRMNVVHPPKADTSEPPPPRPAGPPGGMQGGPPMKKASYTIEYVPFSGGWQKQASTGLQECRDIMNRIYAENPKYWPYGLDTEGMDGGCYLVRDKMTKQAAGFVGWQERFLDNKNVGFYAIGILPEYRNRGFAKEAVAKVIREKAAGVDEVRAFIVKGNAPSYALANSLHVPIMNKCAGAMTSPDPSRAAMMQAAKMATPPGGSLPTIIDQEAPPPAEAQNDDTLKKDEEVLQAKSDLEKAKVENEKLKTQLDILRQQQDAAASIARERYELEQERLKATEAGKLEQHRMQEEAAKQKAMLAEQKAKVVEEAAMTRANAVAEAATASAQALAEVTREGEEYKAKAMEEARNKADDMLAKAKQNMGGISPALQYSLDSAINSLKAIQGIKTMSKMANSGVGAGQAQQPQHQPVVEITTTPMGSPPAQPESLIKQTWDVNNVAPNTVPPNPFRGGVWDFVQMVNPFLHAFAGFSLLPQYQGLGMNRLEKTTPVDYYNYFNDMAGDPRLSKTAIPGYAPIYNALNSQQNNLQYNTPPSSLV